MVPASNMNLLRDNGTWTIGMTDNRTKTIYLYNKLNPIMLKHVLCHELVHAYCDSYGIYLDRKEEEWLAQFIADYGYNIIEQTDQILSHILQNQSGYALEQF